LIESHEKSLSSGVKRVSEGSSEAQTMTGTATAELQWVMRRT
jgi:hypothetical protein